DEEIVDGVAGAIGIVEFFDGEEEHAAAEGFAGAQEFLAFFVRADAENGNWAIVHVAIPGGVCVRKAARRLAEVPRIILWTLARGREIAGRVRRARPKP